MNAKYSCLSLFCLLIFIFMIFLCGCKKESIQLSNDLSWNYYDVENSALVWKGNIVVGPGDITLKCRGNLIYGICNKNKISTFFIFDTIKKEFIKNPPIKDIQGKYNITINLNDWYNHIEIFGPHKSTELIRKMKEDIALTRGESTCETSYKNQALTDKDGK